MNIIPPLSDLCDILKNLILVTNERINRKFWLSTSLGSTDFWGSVPWYYLKFRVRDCPPCLVLQWRQIVLIKRSTVSYTKSCKPELALNQVTDLCQWRDFLGWKGGRTKEGGICNKMEFFSSIFSVPLTDFVNRSESSFCFMSEQKFMQNRRYESELWNRALPVSSQQKTCQKRQEKHFLQDHLGDRDINILWHCPSIVLLSHSLPFSLFVSILYVASIRF